MAKNTGSISGTLFNDNDADGIFDANEQVTGPRVAVLRGVAGTAKLTTGADSRFNFAGLAAGRYELTREFPKGYRLSNNAEGFVVINLAEGQTVTQDLGTTNLPVPPVPPLGSISGTLFNDTDGDGKLDPGETLTGVRTVRIASADGKPLGNTSASSGADSKYTFVGLPAGVYRVSRDFPAGYKLSNNDKGYIEVVVGPGENVTGIDIGTTNDKKKDEQPAPVPIPDKPEEPTPPPVTPPSPIPVTTRRVTTMAMGMCDGGRHTPELLNGYYDDLNIVTISPWVGTLDYGTYKRDNDVDNCMAFAVKRKNCKILWRCAQGGLTRARVRAGAVAWHLAHAADMIKVLDGNEVTCGQPVYIQVGNEPDNGTEYYTDGIASYVNDLMIPVGKALTAKFGDRVVLVTAGFSYNDAELIKYAPSLKAAGYKILAFHGYPLGVTKDHYTQKRIANLVIFAASIGMSVWRTEANIGYGKGYRLLIEAGKLEEAEAYLTKWSQDVAEDILLSNAFGVKEYHYFIAYDAQTQASPAHLFVSKKKAGQVIRVDPTRFVSTVTAVMAA